MTNWLNPQDWRRDGDSPCISLGLPGTFDDSHIFAPCVVYERGSFMMWYCGSRGTVSNRVFCLGLATSRDGVRFGKHLRSPVFGFSDGQRSVLTPTLLRHPDGSVRRQDGKFRMWFTACDLTEDDGLHTLHETTSLGGLTRIWYASRPAPPYNHKYFAVGTARWTAPKSS